VSGQNVFQKIISTPDTNLIYWNSNILPTTDSCFLVLCNNKAPYNADTSKLCVLKINSSGNVVWQKILSTDSSIFGGYINYSNDGFIIAATSPEVPAAFPLNDALILIKTNFNGDTLWTKTYPGGGCGNYIKQMQNGDYIVVGTTTGFLYFVTMCL